MLKNVVPLKGSFMVVSIVGLMISSLYVTGLSKTWGFTFILFFAAMFIASMISMTYAPVLPELDEQQKKKK
jgi:hypothetical protein